MSCVRKDCSVRAKVNCVNKMCMSCCLEHGKKQCEPHMEKYNKKNDEERYIEEGIRAASTKRGRRAFRHEEVGLTDIHQTVVIWCLQDFCLNKGWSAPTFAQYDRKKLSDKLKIKRKKRLVGNEEELSNGYCNGSNIRLRRSLERHESRRMRYQQWLDERAGTRDTQWILDDCKV